MDSDLAWVNDKSGRQSWRYADAFQRSIVYNIGSHLPFYHYVAVLQFDLAFLCLIKQWKIIGSEIQQWKRLAILS